MIFLHPRHWTRLIPRDDVCWQAVASMTSAGIYKLTCRGARQVDINRSCLVVSPNWGDPWLLERNDCWLQRRRWTHGVWWMREKHSEDLHPKYDSLWRLLPARRRTARRQDFRLGVCPHSRQGADSVRKQAWGKGIGSGRDGGRRGSAAATRSAFLLGKQMASRHGTTMMGKEWWQQFVGNRPLPQGP